MRRSASRWLVVLVCALRVSWVAADVEHVVVPGDTLYDIAVTYGSSVADIQARNGLAGNGIRAGQVLIVPVDPIVPGFRLHLAEPGEDLGEVARRFELPDTALRSANPALVSVDDLGGQLVVVPPAAGTTVWVGEGETMIDLAARHGVAPSELAAANGLAAGAVLEVDQPLLIPEGSAGIGAVTDGSGGSHSTPPQGVPAVAGGDGRARHRQQQRLMLGQAWRYAAAIERPSEVFVFPLEGRLSSGFGWRDISVAGNRLHGGIDLASPAGTPIAAARDGVVSKAGWGGAYGYVVYLEHGDLSQTRYAHMMRIDAEVGDVVRQGDRLGLVGSTGASTGPHLHFELRFAGRAVDPLLYLEATPR